MVSKFLKRHFGGAVIDRILNKDGTFNLASKRNQRFFSDPYHFLLAMDWIKFFSLLVAGFIGINLIFGAVYFIIGSGSFSGIQKTGPLDMFLEFFFFSVHTFGTIGYGNVVPTSTAANFVVTMESMTSIGTIAGVTGLIFARFSKPTAKVIYSENAVIHDIDGTPCFLFRMANARLNQIANAHVQVNLVQNEYTKEGEKYRNFYDLKLERSNSPLFALSWTVVHPIEKGSPIYGMSVDDLRKIDAEFIVTLTGIDETLNNNIISRFSYVPDEIFMNKKFDDMLTRDSHGEITIDLKKISALKN